MQAVVVGRGDLGVLRGRTGERSARVRSAPDKGRVRASA
jgi:hypothetical protein